jgi:hypothetical protein
MSEYFIVMNYCGHCYEFVHFILISFVAVYFSGLQIIPYIGINFEILLN